MSPALQAPRRSRRYRKFTARFVCTLSGSTPSTGGIQRHWRSRSFFANVEIQIEGGAGWAADLPVTFRIEDHWLLDLFWGGRPLTGYHAWVFSFMALTFHLPLQFFGRWTPRLKARVLGCLCVFWIVEDALWFVLNPAYGWAKLTPEHVPWHVHWFMGVVPTDYVTFTLAGAALVVWSFMGRQPPPRPQRRG